MTHFKKIDVIIRNSSGIIRTAQIIEAGIPKQVFYMYVKARELKQVAHGIYITNDTWLDTMYVLHLRCEQLIFSHDTALFFHDLSDREPLSYACTVRTGYNPSKLKSDGIQVYTIKKELHELGRINMRTPFGHEVPVYDMERTICDLIRNRSRIEIQDFQSALKQYTKRRDKNLRILMQYAKVFHVDKKLQEYLEVLL